MVHHYLPPDISFFVFINLIYHHIIIILLWFFFFKIYFNKRIKNIFAFDVTLFTKVTPNSYIIILFQCLWVILYFFLFTYILLPWCMSNGNLGEGGWYMSVISWDIICHFYMWITWKDREFLYKILCPPQCSFIVF